MELLLIILVSLPVLTLYLFIIRCVRRRGDTPFKRRSLRVMKRLHQVSLGVLGTAFLFACMNLRLRFGLDFIAGSCLILSGIAIFALMPSWRELRDFWEMCGALWYVAGALMIVFWFFSAMILAAILFEVYGSKTIYEDRHYEVRDMTTVAMPMDIHTFRFAKKWGPLKKIKGKMFFNDSRWKIVRIKVVSRDRLRFDLKYRPGNRYDERLNLTDSLLGREIHRPMHDRDSVIFVDLDKLPSRLDGSADF